MSSRKQEHQERGQTDSKLTAERKKTDATLSEWSARASESTDDVVRVARERAAKILTAARLREDLEDGNAASRRDERSQEDEGLLRTQTQEDEEQSLATEARDRIIEELLKAERGSTDTALRSERARADQRIRTQDEFFAMASHDIRNLVANIALASAIIVKNAETPATVVKWSDRIQRTLGRMHLLLQDLTEVASIESGKIAVNPTEADVATLVDEVMVNYQPDAENKGIVLTADVPSPLPALCDQDRMHQVIGNLLNNALKFTPRGGKVGVTAKSDGKEIHLMVADTGPGIPLDKQGAIFEAFQQAGKTDRRGFGLGLYIAKHVVQAHGGRIWVESTPGAGSTFHFTLPAAG